jgi:hypothetical protein
MEQQNIHLDYYSKLKLVEDILIPHSHFSRAVSRLRHVIDLSSKGAEARHTLLVGESGTGKTWLAKYVQSLYPCGREGGETVIPVLLVETPARPSLKGLAEAILTSLGDPFADRGTIITKRKRALGLLARCKVELIVLDEFQHFLDHGIFDSMHAVSDWLKLFIEDVKVPFMLMGLPRCAAILQMNEQLRRRFSSRLELPTLSIDTETGELEFRTVLHQIDKALPTDQLSGLAEVTMARRLHFASNGHLGYLRTLITKAFELMASESRAQLDANLLEQAFVEVIWHEGTKALNPFNAAFQFRRLDRIGEPFAIATPPQRTTRRRATA